MMAADFCLVPGVLIALPQLRDENFERSVIMMIEHTDQGALGLVINRTTSQHCSAVTDSFELDWPGPFDEPLKRGGPVEANGLWMLHDDGWCFDETMRVVDGLAVSRSREALTRMCNAHEERLRLYVGYAGWGAGQLEQEIAEGSWLTAPASPAMIFDWPTNEVWKRSIGALGIRPEQLIDAGATRQ